MEFSKLTEEELLNRWEALCDHLDDCSIYEEEPHPKAMEDLSKLKLEFKRRREQ